MVICTFHLSLLYFASSNYIVVIGYFEFFSSENIDSFISSSLSLFSYI